MIARGSPPSHSTGSRLRSKWNVFIDRRSLAGQHDHAPPGRDLDPLGVVDHLRRPTPCLGEGGLDHIAQAARPDDLLLVGPVRLARRSEKGKRRAEVSLPAIVDELLRAELVSETIERKA